MSIKEYAARALSSRQKSIVRRYLHMFGVYELRPAEEFIDAVVSLDGAKTFLQIGANDGYLADPLNLAIYRHKLQGTFVEPQRYYFERLRNTYAGFRGLTFLQCAIAENAGTMTMYSLDCSSGLLPRWAHGVGTLSHAQLLRLADQIPDVEKYIVTDNVTCMSVRELLERTPITNPDIVVVDAEGYDSHILTQFDFGKLGAQVVIFETESMPAQQRSFCAAGFEQTGFALVPAGQDTIAIRRTTATWKRYMQSDAEGNVRRPTASPGSIGLGWRGSQDKELAR
jgi:FkbM family methyltransferase